MSRRLFTLESVTEGHPDKTAARIGDTSRAALPGLVRLAAGEGAR
ncbi:hypothetical protein [Streptomyces sp. SudanB182_2057]